MGNEVKAAARATDSDFKPLRKLASAVGSAFVAGIVLYTGMRSYNLEDNLFVMPIDRLWLG